MLKDSRVTAAERTSKRRPEANAHGNGQAESSLPPLARYLDGRVQTAVLSFLPSQE